MNLTSLPEGETVWAYMKTLANKRFKLNSPFYEDGNKICQIRLRSVAVDVDDEDFLHERSVNLAPGALSGVLQGCSALFLISCLHRDVLNAGF